MAKLSEFTSKVRSLNLARPNLYMVSIFTPTPETYSDTSTQPPTQKDKPGSIFADELVNMFCCGASTPFMNIFTNDAHTVNGINHKYAYSHDTQPLVLQFYVDEGYKTKEFFDKWLKLVTPSARNFKYYDNVVAPLIRVHLLSTGSTVTKDGKMSLDEGETVYIYDYYRALPKTVSNIDLTYNAASNVSTFSVEFVYEEFKGYTQSHGEPLPPTTSDSTTFPVSDPTSVSWLTDDLDFFKNNFYLDFFTAETPTTA